MSSQTKEEIEKFYEQPDPWEYTKLSDDQFRRSHILYVASLGAPQRILEVGAGEGFITRGLMQICDDIDVIEISDTAAARLPKEVRRVHEPEGQYDLVLLAGVLYDQYEWEKMREWAERSNPEVIITSHYDKVGEAHDSFGRQLTFEAKFTYRDGYQILKVWR